MCVIHNQVNVVALFENYNIVLNYTVQFVHSPLNSTVCDYTLDIGT